jgi:hypothetical protein
MSLSLDSFVAVPMSHELYAQLVSRYQGGVASVVEQVVQDFLDRTAEDFAAKLPKRSTTGVQWDSLFLPDGTQLRTKYYGSYQLAEVEDGALYWDGEEQPSVAQLANAMRGGTNNNAWKVLEIKRPQDAVWQLADRLRK